MKFHPSSVAVGSVLISILLMSSFVANAASAKSSVYDENIKNHRVNDNAPELVRPVQDLPSLSSISAPRSPPKRQSVPFKPSAVDESPFQSLEAAASVSSQQKSQILPAPVSIPSQTGDRPIFARSLGETGEPEPQQDGDSLEELNTAAQTVGRVLPGLGWNSGYYNGGYGGYGSGFGSGYNSGEKPGTCYRPSFGYDGGFGSGIGIAGYNNYNSYPRTSGQNNAGFYITRSDSTNNIDARVRRDAPVSSYGYNNYNYGIPAISSAYGTGGGHGGIVYPTTPKPYYCLRDFECPGNQKCCSGYCSTPSFVG